MSTAQSLPPGNPPHWPLRGGAVLLIHLVALGGLWRFGDWTRSTDVLMGWALGAYFMMWERSRRS